MVLAAGGVVQAAAEAPKHAEDVLAPETRAQDKAKAQAREEKSTSADDAATFDVETLRARGIDPAVAEYFRAGSRFQPGAATVTLKVNGMPRGMAEVRFDNEGRLCFERRLLDAAALVIPADFPKTGEPDCYDYVASHPRTVVTLKPNAAMVELVVPADAIRLQDDVRGGYTTGGAAGLFNYDAMIFRTAGPYGSSQFQQLGTEAGFNIGDWILRSHQMVSSQAGVTQWSYLYAYAQKTFPAYKSVLQAGQINVAGSVFGGTPIVGLQVFPEQALRRANGRGALVQGIAQTQARVEVRQLGALVYSTLVPPGPFSLPHVPVLYGNTGMDVTVIESNGASRTFTIPAAALLGVEPVGDHGYSVAIGKLQSNRGSFGAGGRAQPWLLTASGGWQTGAQSSANAGFMLSEKYVSLGGAFASMLPLNLALSTRATVASDLRNRNSGALGSVALSTRVGEALSASVTATRQTAGYRDLGDSTATDGAGPMRWRFRDQYTANMAWSNDRLGGFAFGYSQSSSFGSDFARRVTASWSRSFERMTLSLNAERSVGGTVRDTAFYLNLSVPLEEHHRLCQRYGPRYAPGRERVRDRQRLGGVSAFGSVKSARPAGQRQRQSEPEPPLRTGRSERRSLRPVALLRRHGTGRVGGACRWRDLLGCAGAGYVRHCEGRRCRRGQDLDPVGSGLDQLRRTGGHAVPAALCGLACGTGHPHAAAQRGYPQRLQVPSSGPGLGQHVELRRTEGEPNAADRDAAGRYGTAQGDRPVRCEGQLRHGGGRPRDGVPA
jgi:outer membrane usher protein FimD/PapC